jgi:hypothetical protein
LYYLSKIKVLLDFKKVKCNISEKFLYVNVNISYVKMFLSSQKSKKQSLNYQNDNNRTVMTTTHFL